MSSRCLGCLVLATVAGLTEVSPSFAAKPWELLIPFKRVEAAPDKNYDLTESQGPWMVLCTSFAGAGAEKQARELVLELRKSFKLPAYVHKQSYDFTKSQVGLGLNRYGEPKKMRYVNPTKFDEIAVLVGDFESVEDPRLDKAVQKIKAAKPDCLDVSKNKSTTQRFASLRELQRKFSSEGDKRQLGPMGNAIVTRNPLLPKEYFNPGGLDSFVEEMNRGVEYSLLKNRGRYSVRVATFRGSSKMGIGEVDTKGKPLPSKLEEAAMKANELTLALRKKGVEAYEFHDRYESIVTIGSFESIGFPRQDGKTEMQPEVLRIIQEYGAQRQNLPGQSGVGLVPRNLNGICYDVQPLPVEVPKTSVATAYAPGNKLFR